MKKTKLVFKHTGTGLVVELYVDASGSPRVDQKEADAITKIMEDAGYKLQPAN